MPALGNTAYRLTYTCLCRFRPQAAQKAAPVDLQVKSLEGSDGGTGQLSLRVAEPTKSKGLVHRHVVLIQQNARQVIISWLICSDTLRFDTL